MKKVVINGATSFLAIHLIEELTKSNNYEIYAVIRNNSKKRNKLDKYKNLNIIECDMYKIHELLDSVSSCDIFFNFAWNGTRGESRKDSVLQEKNVEASIETLKIAKMLKTKVFFSAGSQAEYGLVTNNVSEMEECKPITEYGKSKLKFYNYAIDFCKKNNIKFYEPRFFSVYGPNDFEGTLVISTISKMLKNEEIDFSPATQVWNYLYVKDVAIALVKLMNSDAESGAYNFGSNDTRVLKDFILEMKKITNSESVLNFGTIPMGDSAGVNPNIIKLENAIGTVQNYSFEEGIKEIISSLKEV